MDRIKVGIIGAGFIGSAHVEALRRLGFVEIVALAESKQAIAEQKAKQLNIPKSYSDYRKLLEDKEIVVVHNCTPNYLHFQINQDIINSGKNVISEKPLTISSQESKKLVELIKKTKLVNAVNYNYRFYPIIQQAKQMIANGELGEIYLIHGSYLQDWLYYDTDYNWRVNSALGGSTRAISDIGSHWCDLVQYITGLRIVKVFGDLKTIHSIRKQPKYESQTFVSKELKPTDFKEIKIETEDCASVLLTFSNGVKGVFVVSQVSAGRKNRLYFEINGSKKSIAWNQENPEELWIGYRDKPNEILMRDPSLMSKEAKKYVHYPGGHPEGYLDSIYNFMRSFYDFVIGKKKVNIDNADFATFEDGNNEVVICEAILESSKKQSWVEINVL